MDPIDHLREARNRDAFIQKISVDHPFFSLMAWTHMNCTLVQLGLLEFCISRNIITLDSKG